LHGLEGLFVDERRPRIEARQHAGDRRADQLGVGDRINRVLADPLKGLDEEIQLFVNAVLTRFLLSGNTACDEQCPNRVATVNLRMPKFLAATAANRRAA